MLVRISLDAHEALVCLEIRKDVDLHSLRNRFLHDVGDGSRVFRNVERRLRARRTDDQGEAQATSHENRIGQEVRNAQERSLQQGL
jgi:hypothetical protein